MIKKIGLKQAGLIYITMSIITVIVHLLVIFRLMPYTWINGGRSATYEIARQTSINSIPYFIIVIAIALLVCGIIRVRWNSVVKKIISILLWIMVAYTCLGLIFQLLGTPFEKTVMSVVCVISIIMEIRLAIEKR
jgi:hypothetical protein